MDKKIPKEELWKVYNNLPEDLKTAIFSEDTADAIWNICKLCNINDVSIVAKEVGNVLMGFLPPEKIGETLKKKLKIDESAVKKLEINIQHYIFNPVIDDLMEIYHPEKLEEAKREFKEIEKKKKKKGKDVYRETL